MTVRELIKALSELEMTSEVYRWNDEFSIEIPAKVAYFTQEFRDPFTDRRRPLGVVLK